MAAVCSENVEIRENLPNKGRGLFASRSIPANEVIIEEGPLVCSQFLWSAFYKYKACDHCMRAMETAEENCRRLTGNPGLDLPHPECCEVKKEDHIQCPHCQVTYCSAACRDTAWETYHQVLCLGQSVDDPEHPLNRLQEAWRNTHFPPETASIMLIARMIATVKQAKDKRSIISRFAQFCQSTVNEEEQIAHKLLGKEFESQLAMLQSLLVEALYEEDLAQWFTPKGIRSLFALLGTNGQGIGTSSLSVWVKNCESLPQKEKEQLDPFIDQLYIDIDQVSGSFLDCEGSGLYVLQSICNHSCEPNAEVTFPHNNSTLALKSLKEIKAGEEICICYLGECDRDRSRHSRQAILQENYLFTCMCQKCLDQADDPDVTSEEEEEEEMEQEEGTY